ncbi:MAG: glycine cleavage system protein T [Chloroflexi bacterium]|nr:glycine cleavage system protein T [Chloroflexota bacterium]
MNAESLETYRQIVDGCGIVDASDRARLWATGRDRIDLIHRMSTNDLRGMAVNEGRATVLTTALARMVDRIIVIHLGERALILGSADAAETIRRWLSSYVFFNDDVKFADASAELGQFVLFGPQAESVAEKLLPGASSLKPYCVMERDGLIVGRGDAVAGGGFFAVMDREAMKGWWAAAASAGAVEAGSDVYEVMRVESGLPIYGHEIGEGFIPLEAALWGEVSFTKGCYIGQEIIARMESRGKLAKTLVGLKSASQLTMGEFGGGVTITSVTHSPRWGWIGLGFARPAQAESGAEIEIGDAVVRVAHLPFRD